MRFLDQVAGSLYRPDYYRSLISVPLRQSLWYYMSLGLWLALIFALLLTFALGPRLRELGVGLVPAVNSVYPDELVIEIEDGRAATNMETPYSIPLPSAWRLALAGSPLGNPRQLLVLDPVIGGEIDSARFEAYDTLFLITGDSLAFRNNFGLGVEPLSSFGRVTVDAAAVSVWAQAASGFIDRLLPFLPLIIFLAGIFYLGLYSIFLFLPAIIVWQLAHIREVPVSYLQAYQFTLHAATAALLFKFFAFWLLPGVNLFFIPTLVLLLVAALNLKPPRELVLQEEI